MWGSVFSDFLATVEATLRAAVPRFAIESTEPAPAHASAA